MNSVEQRLRILERELRRSKLINRTLAIAFVSIICIAATNPNDDPKSESNDQRTKTPAGRASVAPDSVKDKSRLDEDRLFDSSGVAIAGFESARHKNVAQLSFRSEQGRSQLRASGLSVFDSEDSQRLLMALINGNFRSLG